MRGPPLASHLLGGLTRRIAARFRTGARDRWKPTRAEKVPPGTECKPVSGRLIYVRLQRDRRQIDLWLFTPLPSGDEPIELLVRWSGQRWLAELNFR